MLTLQDYFQSITIQVGQTAAHCITVQYNNNENNNNNNIMNVNVIMIIKYLLYTIILNIKIYTFLNRYFRKVVQDKYWKAINLIFKTMLLKNIIMILSGFLKLEHYEIFNSF